MSWTVTPTRDWLVQIRALLDSDDGVGVPLDYEGTIDGAWTYAGAELAYRVDQAIADAISAVTLDTAPRSVVVARALDRQLTPREATSSTLELALTDGSGGVIPVGTVLRVVSGDVTIEDDDLSVTVPLPRSRWEVVENANAGELVESGDVVVVRCQTPGRVSVGDPTTFAPSSTISGVSELTWETGQARTLGRAAERTSELRQRVRDARSTISGTDPGMVTALREIPWVVAAGIESTPGYVRVTVAPEPPTDADEATLAETIYRSRAAGAVTLGDESRTIEGADGRDVTVRWDVGDTVAVTVAITLTPAPQVSEADAMQAARDAIRDVFASLSPGDPVLYLRAYGALDQPAIRSATLTLDGGTVDVSPPTAADILVPVFA